MSAEDSREAGPAPGRSDGERGPGSRRLRGFLLRLLVTVGLGTVLVFQVDLGRVAALFADMRFAPLALAVALYAVDRVLGAYKWKILFEANGPPLPLLQSLKIMLQSSFLGVMLPGTVGIDAIRAVMVKGVEEAEDVEFSYALSSVVAERILGFAGLLLCAALGILLFARSALAGWTWMLGVAASLAAVAFVAWLFLWSVDRVGEREPPGFLRRAPEPLKKVGRFVGSIASWLRAYRDRPAVLAGAFGIAFFQQYLFIGFTWILGLALGLSVGLVDLLWIWPLVLVAVRLPLSFLGFGVREVLALRLLSGEGVPPDSAVTLGLASGGLDLLFVAFGGLWLLVDSPGLRDLKGRSEPRAR